MLHEGGSFFVSEALEASFIEDTKTYRNMHVYINQYRYDIHCTLVINYSSINHLDSNNYKHTSKF